MTPRMRQAWLLAALGLSNKEIGVQMSLSPQSVKNLLRRVFDVLGVRNRTEATLRALLLAEQHPDSSFDIEHLGTQSFDDPRNTSPFVGIVEVSKV